MIIPFYKMHGTGNDFIVIDNRTHLIQKYSDNQQLIYNLCHRHFGIGADGLILLNTKVGYHFEMVYFNADGRVGSMCGNGGRCAVAVANFLNISPGKVEFWSGGNAYQASIIKKKKNETFVKLRMNDVTLFEKHDNYIFMDTVSPHHIEFVENVEAMDIVEAGRPIRYSDLYAPAGTNVDFVELNPDYIFVRTYERGVEDETLSCGTGVVASSIASYISEHYDKTTEFRIKTLGGELKVSFTYKNNIFTDIFLEGPAELVFKGELEL